MPVCDDICISSNFINPYYRIEVGERCIEKKSKKKLAGVSFMYVCVAENVELLVFFTFFAPSP